MKQIHGIFAVTVTHFQENGEIDYAACAKHINWLIESGVHGLLPLGATGEFSALTLEERKAFAEFAMKEVAGRVPVIIGAVSTNVDVTLEVAKHAASIGADGVMILPPPAPGFRNGQRRPAPPASRSRRAESAATNTMRCSS